MASGQGSLPQGSLPQGSDQGTLPQGSLTQGSSNVANFSTGSLPQGSDQGSLPGSLPQGSSNVANFSTQGLLNALGNIPKAIFTAFAAPAGSTAAPADPQYRQPGFVAWNCGVASLSFKLRGCEVKFLKAIGIIMLGGVASVGLMKLVAVGKLMF